MGVAMAGAASGGGDAKAAEKRGAVRLRRARPLAPISGPIPCIKTPPTKKEDSRAFTIPE